MVPSGLLLLIKYCKSFDNLPFGIIVWRKSLTTIAYLLVLQVEWIERWMLRYYISFGQYSSVFSFFRKSGDLSVRIPTSTKFKSSLILRWWESLQSRMPLFLKMFLFLHWWDDQFWCVEIWTPPVWCLFSFLIRWRLNRVCDEFHYIFSGDEHFGFLSSI